MANEFVNEFNNDALQQSCHETGDDEEFLALMWIVATNFNPNEQKPTTSDGGKGVAFIQKRHLTGGAMRPKITWPINTLCEIVISKSYEIMDRS